MTPFPFGIGSFQKELVWGVVGVGCSWYGVAMISRLLENIGLSCRV